MRYIAHQVCLNATCRLLLLIHRRYNFSTTISTGCDSYCHRTIIDISKLCTSTDKRRRRKSKSTQLITDVQRNGIPSAPPAVPESINLTKCHETPEGLINNIANNGLPRFKVVQDCVTVTGKVTFVHTPSDGDTVFALKPNCS
jgi:hypothetical protein